VRNAFTRFGGHAGGRRGGLVPVPPCGTVPCHQGVGHEDALIEVALEAGADDIISTGDGFEIRCDVHAFDRVAHALEHRGIKAESAEIA